MLCRVLIKITGLALCSVGIWLAAVMTQLFISSDIKQVALIWYIPVMMIAVILILAGFGLLRAKDWQEVRDTIEDGLWWVWMIH